MAHPSSAYRFAAAGVDDELIPILKLVHYRPPERKVKHLRGSQSSLKVLMELCVLSGDRCMLVQHICYYTFSLDNGAGLILC